MVSRLDDRPTAKVAKDDIPASHVSGQLFADDLADEAVAAGVKAVTPDLNGVLADIQAMTSYEDLRARLKKRLAGMDRAAAATIIERATILAHSAGRKAVLDATK
jgi:phage gp29-like protein